LRLTDGGLGGGFVWKIAIVGRRDRQQMPSMDRLERVDFQGHALFAE
jgi:hypothetical protein